MQIKDNGQWVRVMLRLPATVHAKMVESAARHQRSLNGEIIAALNSMSGSTNIEAMQKELDELKKTVDALARRVGAKRK